jgi:amidophosphoribosyltransferase
MCGIIGIVDNIVINKEHFINLLKKIQHRGQESYGFCYLRSRADNQNTIITEKFQGKINNTEVTDFYSKMIIGHCRYSTSGKSKLIDYDNQSKLILEETQPISGKNILGEFKLIHNGNIPNIEADDSISDSHTLVKYIENYKIDTDVNDINNSKTKREIWLTILKNLLLEFKKAYCLIIMTIDELYILRDIYGVRPLCLGYNESGWCVASESAAFMDKYNFIRDVEPGEIIRMNCNGIKTLYKHHIDSESPSIQSRCLFEYIYFLSENSYADNHQVSKLRYSFGCLLAEQDIEKGSVLNDVLVVGSPSTGIPSGKGYADTLGLQYRQVLKKNVNIGRTFILENNKKRDNACKKKYYLDVDLIQGRKIVIVDDSLVRGHTIKNLIKIFRDAGAIEVHIRIAAPPIKEPCYYGIDIPTKEELIANNYSLDKISEIIGADSLFYIKMDKIKKLLKSDFKNLCTGCFDGKYQNIDW